MTAPDELERSVTALLDQFERDPAPPVVPTTAISVIDFHRDASGVFLTIDLVDGSEIYVTLSLGEPVVICHVPLPARKPTPTPHLFIVRNSPL